jgi:nucleoside-diphosphate-sugar epimerase
MPFSELQDVSILVTGASGFVGGRLVERLAREDQAKVVGSGRTFSNPDKLEKIGVELARADVRDIEAMKHLCKGKHVVLHLAAWLERGKGGEHDAYAVNVDATRALVKAAASAGVQRFVLVSTVAAYGLPNVDDIHEEVPVDVQQEGLYGKTKALGEIAAQEAARGTDLSLTIVRPAMIYGPGSTAWTIGMLKLVQKGVPVLFGSGGFAYPVYIDDLVDLLRLCAFRPEAAGEAFNASDASIPWEQFFGYYGRMCGKRPRRVPMPIAHVIARLNETFRLGLPLTRDRLAIYQRLLRYPTTKAEQRLGFQVQVPIDEGMRRSETWLREVGRLK